MSCKVYESTKLFNSKSKQKQIRPTRIQLRKRHRTISFTESDPLCLYTDTGDTDTNMELTPFKQELIAEPVNPRDPLNLNSLHNNKKKKKIENNNNDNKEREEMETCKHKQTYVYGNYPCYYGYRMECSRDPRLDLFTSDMFHNKKCLDIGCNSGAITIKIARDFTPLFIEGVDLDPELIRRANKNVRYSLGGVGSSFTDSTTKPEIGMFPQNISFKTHNYVLLSDEMLERYVSEISYDVILCLSVTKWVQLNWGDDGVKRLFARIYKDLSPNGVLLLESQGYSGYAKRAKLSPHMREHYRNIKLRPTQFPDYLTGTTGFSSREVLGTPCHSSKGFSREIELYRKPL